MYLLKLILKRTIVDGALYTALCQSLMLIMANDASIEIRDISWCVPLKDPSNDNRIIVQKGLNKESAIVFRYYERLLSLRKYLMLLNSPLILEWRAEWKEHKR